MSLWHSMPNTIHIQTCDVSDVRLRKWMNDQHENEGRNKLSAEKYEKTKKKRGYLWAKNVTSRANRF